MPARPTLRETVGRLAPGTALRDGLERILRGRTGALIVLGYDDTVESICDGGFALDVRYAPTRLRELSKMDGAVVLSTDGGHIVRANVQLVPDPSISTDESGTRHRSAERTAVQTGYPVISVSHSMSTVTVYVAGERHVVADSATILSRANQAIATLERYKARLDEVSRQLSAAEIEDFVTLRDVMTVVQRLEMVRRISLEIDYDTVELGTDGRQLRLQLEELVGGNDTARELIVRDYHANPEPPSTAQLSTTLEELDKLSDTELLDFTALARVFGYPPTVEAQDSALSSRGYRAMAEIPRLQFAHVDLLVRTFGSLQGLLAASATDLQSVDGIGAMWARHVLVPVDDEAAVLIAEHASELAVYFRFPWMANAGLTRALASKHELLRLCQQHGFPAPESVFVSSAEEIAQFAATATFPVVAKNAEPWVRRRAPAVNGTTVLRSAAELLALTGATRGSPTMILQEYIPHDQAEDWIVHLYCDAGANCRVLFTAVKLRSWPPNTGATTCAIAVPNPALAQLAEHFCKAVGFHGIADLDVRFDRRDERYKLVDFNPRMGNQFRLFETGDGIDVVRAQYLDMTGQRVPPGEQISGRRFVLEHIDLLSRISQRGSGYRTPSAPARATSTELAWLALDDPLPFLAMLPRFTALAISTLSRRRHHLGAAPEPNLGRC